MEKAVINKWNGKEYTLLGFEGGLAKLRRSDSSEFCVAIPEYKFSYKEVKDDSFRAEKIS